MVSKRAIDVGLQMNENESMRYSALCQKGVLASAEFQDKIANFLKAR
jgi:hypothetical protein